MCVCVISLIESLETSQENSLTVSDNVMFLSLLLLLIFFISCPHQIHYQVSFLYHYNSCRRRTYFYVENRSTLTYDPAPGANKER